MIPGSANPLLLASAAGAAPSYQIERSLRFNSSDSAYLSRDLTGANRDVYTLSCWVKRGAIGVRQDVIDNLCIFLADDTLIAGVYNGASGTTVLQTTQVFRDASAWYHLVFAANTASATSSERFKLYVNGVQVTTFSTASYPGQNVDTNLGSVNPQTIGKGSYGGSGYFSGYLADVHFIDGQALDPSSFTEVDATTGQLIPKAYTGTYGTNGFHLDFADNSTAAALGTDTSGNGNDWTVNNLSVGSGGLTTVTGLAVYGTQQSGNINNAFDGNAQFSEVFWGRPDNFGATFNGVTAQSQVRVLASSQSGQIQINQSINTGLNSPYPTFAWLDVSGSLTFPFTLTAVGYTSGSSGDGGGFSAVEVDGKILATTSAINASAPGNDSLVDTPTSYGTDTGAGGEVRGNYCTWNPLLMNSLYMTAANGNLDATCQNSNYNPAALNIHVRVGGSSKWYCEFSFSATPQVDFMGFGLAAETSSIFGTNQIPGSIYMPNGQKSISGTKTTYGSSYVAGDIIGVTVDEATGSLTCYKNGVSQGLLATLTTGTYQFIGVNYGIGTVMTVNTGQRPFAYTAPSGYKALCTANLPDPVVAQPSTVMDVALWTGNGTSQAISGLGFSPDFAWIKQRNATRSHRLFDTVRGAGDALYSDLTSAAQTESNALTSFDSTGFSLGDAIAVNGSTSTYVAWTWDAGSSTVTNTQGSITSQVRANASAGFSITAATMPSSGDPTIGHGLGVKPDFIVFKSRTTTEAWYISHKGLTNQSNRFLRFDTSSEITNANWFASTEPTSSVITLRVGGAVSSNQDIIIYSWAAVDGYSSFGSYTGNGSTDGPFVYTGFRPRFVMIKKSSGADDWVIQDTARDSYNVAASRLFPNLSSADNTASAVTTDICSNGFKIRNTVSQQNSSAATYIYAAFAESPFQYARAR